MNSAIPENATISSNFRSISARRMPMMAPCRYTFSRPVRSGWNPAATSMSAPIRPRTRQWPSVGRRIRVSSFSAVDLPAPLAPMMPRASPGPTENETSRRAQNSALPSGSREPRPSHRASVSGTRSRRLGHVRRSPQNGIPRHGRPSTRTCRTPPRRPPPPSTPECPARPPESEPRDTRRESGSSG